jgi:heptosyltransferase-2
VRPGTRLIAFGPGAGEPRRRWPVTSFIEVGAALERTAEGRIVVVGGGEDRRLGQTLRRALGGGVIDVTGRMTLRQAAALLKRCALYVGNDSGPMHIAAAFGVPIVEISCHPATGSPAHPNSPVRFGPWKVPHVVLQPPGSEACVEACAATEAHCILAIGVEAVSAAVRSLAGPADRRIVEDVKLA